MLKQNNLKFQEGIELGFKTKLKNKIMNWKRHVNRVVVTLMRKLFLKYVMVVVELNMLTYTCARK